MLRTQQQKLLTLGLFLIAASYLAILVAAESTDNPESPSRFEHISCSYSGTTTYCLTSVDNGIKILEELLDKCSTLTSMYHSDQRQAMFFNSFNEDGVIDCFNKTLSFFSTNNSVRTQLLPTTQEEIGSLFEYIQSSHH